MAVKQVGAAPSGTTEAVTKGYVDTAVATTIPKTADITAIVKITQAAYDALGGSVSSTTLYIIVS